MADQALELVIGNKNYSSWSLRPWLLLRHAGIPFTEVQLPLDTDEFRTRIGALSPSGRVPVLRHGALRVWESLAICEYVSEHFLEGAGWPLEPAARAHARAVSAEMHAGFAALRAELPLNCRARRPALRPSEAALRDVSRVLAIWRECRDGFGVRGPWLYGDFSIADAMYAPVALRFVTYEIPLDGRSRRYVEALSAHPDVRRWLAEAAREQEVIERAEVAHIGG